MNNNITDNELNYRVSGDGHPVVFLHGFLESSSMWEGFSLENIKSIRIDLPGHGGSISKHDDFSMKSMARKVKDVLVKLNIDEYSVVGHSMGGYVALELLQISGDCKRLVLLNSNFWNDNPAKVKDRERVAALVREKKEFFIYEVIPNLFYQPEKYDLEVKRLIVEALEISSEVIASTSIAMSKRGSNLGGIKRNPSMIYILQGEKDTIVPIDRMQKEIKGINVNYFQLAAGHMSHIEVKTEVIKLLSTIFLA